MTSTRTYLNYLNDQVDIAPANSQEELDAAHLVKSLMDEHGLDTTLQEFDMPVAGDLAHSIVYLLLFVGVILGGVLDSAAGVAGRVIVLACIILLALRFGGRDVLAGLGSKARSQNVIGVHRASGPLVVKGNRPIVIVAHYDTPNEGLLWRRTLVRYLPVLKRSAFWCVFVVAVCCLFQVMGFLPAPARHVFWIVGIVAALPLLAIGINDVYERFAPCTEGANDNKAAVAAMLGVMDKIRPNTDEAQQWALAHPHAAASVPVEPSMRDDAEDKGGQAPSAEDERAIPDVSSTKEDVDATHVYSPGTIQIDADWVDERKTPREGAESLSNVFGKVRDGATGVFRRIREATAHEEADDGALDEPKLDESTSGEASGGDAAPAILTPLEEIKPTEDTRAMADEMLFEETAAAKAEHVEPEVPEPETSEGTLPSEAPTESKAEPIAAEPEPSAEDAPTQAPAPSIPPIHKLDLTTSQSVRRGAAFVESLNILPEDCEIVYDLPPVPDLDLSTLPEVPEIPNFSVEDFLQTEQGQEEPQPEEDVEAEEPVHHTGYAPSFLDNGYTRRAAEEGARDGRPYVPEMQEGYGDAGTFGEPDAHAEARRERTHEILESVPVPEYEALKGGGGHAPSIGERIRAFFAGLDRRHLQSDEPLDDDDIAVPELLKDDEAPDDVAGQEEANPSEDAPSEEPPLAESATGNTDASHEDLGTIADLDTSGLHVQDDEPSGPDERTTRPEVVDDPNWGKAEYAPQVSSPARRAVLFDLPDPAQVPNDPFATSEESEEDDLDSTEPTLRTKERTLRNDTRPAHDADHPSHWKGGATTRSDLRMVEPDVIDEPSQEREREAVLGMGDDELIAHDVWFVATGASELNHAGMREFLAEYRKQARGAFIVNLECIGAGDLTLLTSEGASTPRRADRRMVRLLSTVASDLHINLAKRRYDWAETDAYSALQSSMRAMTIMGMSEVGTPANAHSDDDTAANVDTAQVVDVTELVAELIRRS